MLTKKRRRNKIYTETTHLNQMFILPYFFDFKNTKTNNFFELQVFVRPLTFIY